MKDNNNKILLQNLGSLSLDIDINLSAKIIDGFNQLLNTLRSPFTGVFKTETPKFVQLIEQLKQSPIKSIHLKCRNMSFDYLKYLINSGLSSLKMLDLSLSNLGEIGATEIVNGNLDLDVLILNRKDTAAAALFTNKLSKTFLYLSKTYKNGSTYAGEWQDNKLHGYGTFTFSDGNTYVGEFKDNKLHGHGKCTYTSGTKYVGEFKDNRLHGHGIVTYDDGGTYDGEWQDGKKHGYGTHTFLDGNTYVFGWQHIRW
ncbi:MAG: MORN repeat-containing protein [Neisseriaceae bacterium]